MREEEIKKMIEDSVGDVKIPESLEPENMMKRLEWLDVDEKKSEAEAMKKKKPVFQLWHYGTLAAALLAVVVFTSVNISLPWRSAPDTMIPAGVTKDEPAIEVDASEAGDDEGEVPQSFERDYQVKSYDEVHDRLQEVIKEQEAQYGAPQRGPLASFLDGLLGGGSDRYLYDNYTDGMMVEETMTADNDLAKEYAYAAAPSASIEAEAELGTGAGYSDTNVQVEGIDEGDIVKTDGTYIYVASGYSGKIRIIRPSGSDLELVGEIDLFIYVFRYRRSR